MSPDPSREKCMHSSKLDVLSCLAGAGSLLLIACSPGRGLTPADTLAVSRSGFGTGAATTESADTVPLAVCGPGSNPETGLQGQVTLMDRLSGRSQEGYSCNLERIGQYRGEGASWQHAWYQDCAYYGQSDREISDGYSPTLQHPGTVVLDVRDPTAPMATAWLADPTMLDPWESLRAAQARGLLMGVQEGGEGFAIYDLKTDCRQPQMLASLTANVTIGHEGALAPDEQTYFGASSLDDPAIAAVDIADPADPEFLAILPESTHGLSISEDGTRAYLARSGTGTLPGMENENGLVILDISEIQQRVQDPDYRTISTSFFADGSGAQSSIAVRYGSRPYLIFFDELGSVLGSPQAACAQNLPPFGFARIFDISDEAQPKLVAKLMNEVANPSNCAATMNDNVSQGLFGYDTHYCAVDRHQDPTALACGQFNSGLRVYDIRDPYRPTEIAYYNPPASPGHRPGSNYNHVGACGPTDWSTSMTRFIPQRAELWFTSQCGGFQVLRFTNNAWPFRPGSTDRENSDGH